MRPDDLNFRHLLYFWAVAKEGSITRAAARLDLSVQTISTQLGLLERQLGQALFAPQGRTLALTEAGKTALVHAEQIFAAGERLRQALAEAPRTRPRLAVGIADAVPKLAAFRLLEPALQPPGAARLECSEGDFDKLLGELALNRLDLVIADRSAPERANVKWHSRLLGNAGMSLYGDAALRKRYGKQFPHGLDGAPFLLPARSDPLRDALDAWLATRAIRPDIVGEFTDGALLKTFGRVGLGLFAAPTEMRDDLHAQYDALPLGPLDGVSENWYAITQPRKVQHPAIALILQSGGRLLVPSRGS